MESNEQLPTDLTFEEKFVKTPYGPSAEIINEVRLMDMVFEMERSLSRVY
jgi:hypothetical protein